MTIPSRWAGHGPRLFNIAGLSPGGGASTDIQPVACLWPPAVQCYFSFKIHYSFSFYTFFHQSFLFLYYISISCSQTETRHCRGRRCIAPIAPVLKAPMQPDPYKFLDLLPAKAIMYFICLFNFMTTCAITHTNR